MKNDVWNPQQYDKFKDERSQPFFDLLELVQPLEQGKAIDLGCGTGELTAKLHDHLKCQSTLGIDSSQEMLNKANAYTKTDLTFLLDNIETWNAPQNYDLIFSNAALQWCSDHTQLFARIKNSLRANGQIAIQMPMNHDYPTHTLAQQMSFEEPWAALLKTEKNKIPKAMLSPEEYATLLFKMGFKEQKVFLRVYGHKLDSKEDVIEWVKGTLLTHFKSKLSEENYKKFLTEYRQRLLAILPDDKPFFYPFKRILLWGRL